MYEPLQLPFGHCRLVVCGRAEHADRSLWLERSPRVATKFPHLTEAYFRRRGLAPELIVMSGSVELAPLVGLTDLIVERRENVEIALVGKYIELPDAYLSVTESLKHAGWANDVDVKVRWVSSETLTEENLARELGGAAGVLNWCGATDLPALVAVLSCAALLVSNDSGAMHVAAALRRPQVAIFGSTSPAWTGPVNAKAAAF